jgi:hypothetical protein
VKHGVAVDEAFQQWLSDSELIAKMKKHTNLYARQK